MNQSPPAIAGATDPTLVLGSADEDHTLRVRETASDGGGQASAESDPTALVPAPVRNVSPPGNAGRVSDPYTVEAADVGSRNRVVVNASNGGGSTQAASALTDPVTAPSSGGSTAPPPTSPPPATTPPITTTMLLRPAAARGPRPRARARAEDPRPLVRAMPGRGAADGHQAGTRKWRVPRTVAAGRRGLAAAGTAVVRPRFAKTTQMRLRPVRALVVAVTAQARDGAGTIVAQRGWKLTLTRERAVSR